MLFRSPCNELCSVTAKWGGDTGTDAGIPFYFMNKFIFYSVLLIPLYFPVRLDMFGVNAFVSNTRPEYVTQVGKINFVTFYISITVPL